ncbi:unnamed protein product [Didymodactylos carnosus]|uniref:Uncharacterized protein n=1 Tax=Didymodactylos carnosus TaxID=1234261 RepID=A0A814RSC5_9BILA|nr:unnamed protein product [Didymodactylos carnosus]CAF3901986.1 unnamed protein product [Didymodactylos carnosus]
MAFIFFQESNKSNHVTLTVSEVCEVLVVTIVLFYTIVSCHKCFKSCSQLPLPLCYMYLPCPKPLPFCYKLLLCSSHLLIDLFFLLLANLALIVYCCFTLYGSSKSSPRRLIEGLTFTASFIPIVQSTVQSIIIFYICTSQTTRTKEETSPSPEPGSDVQHGVKTSKPILHTDYINIWITLSFGIWLFDTFSAKEYETNEIQIRFYGESTWKVIGSILIPLAIFFRFHSCIMFLKIKSNKYNH